MKAIIACVVPLLWLGVLHPACAHRTANQQVPAAQSGSAQDRATASGAAAGEQAAQAGSSAQTSAEAKVFSGEGVVEGIDKSGEMIQINHGDIKGYMPAMSMPYRVKDRSMLDLVKPGDKVTFTLEDTSKGAVLIEIKKS